MMHFLNLEHVSPNDCVFAIVPVLSLEATALWPCCRNITHKTVEELLPLGEFLERLAERHLMTDLQKELIKKISFFLGKKNH